MLLNRNAEEGKMMKEYELGAMESKFADIIWRSAPIASGELVKICERELSWKKSTTYTMLRRLCQKGLFENSDGEVRVLTTREEFQARQSEQFIAENFEGSLPKFLVAFAAKNKLSEQEIAELQGLIEKNRAK
jgi:predicted transcriptional regulator